MRGSVYWRKFGNLWQIRPILGLFLWQFGGSLGCDRGKVGNGGAAAKIAKSNAFLPQRHKEKKEIINLSSIVMIRKILQILQNQNPFCDDPAVVANGKWRRRWRR